MPVGGCAITTGGALKARYVIHAVGPRFGEGDEENKLRKTVKNVLELATSKGFKSIAMPAISAGIFGFPKDKCAHILVEETVTFTESKATTLEGIIFYLMDKDIINFFINEVTKQKRGAK